MTTIKNAISIASTQSDLLEELTETTAEQLSGGAISTPDTQGGDSRDRTPVPEGNNGLSRLFSLVTPVYSGLPTPKLARLGPLTKTSKTPEAKDTPPPQP